MLIINKYFNSELLEFKNNTKVTKKPIVDIIFNIFIYILSNNNYLERFI